MRVISLLCAVQLTSFVFGSANSADQDGPPSLTLWDVGFSLRDAWAALRDIPCPAPLPGTVLHEPVPPDSNEVDQDIVSFEDWRRLRDLDGPEQHSQDEISAEARPDTAVPDALAQPINKYNYASPDCSARVLAFSSLTQHASSLLHKSRDRYMLTPCKAHDHWVVVELCDEIRIQAIELSVWEFFSGIVRDIKVSVGTELEDDLDWVTVDTFVGKNIRGAQTFTFNQPTAFYRFIRLDFLSHYGSEYYCPVSHLKVFGLNQMEAFKWEQKQVALREEIKEPKVVPDSDTSLVTEQETKGEESTVDGWDSVELREIEKMVQAQAELHSEETTTIIPDAVIESTNNTTSETPKSKSESSESIYAFIIRRLDALEGNSSLVARYVDEQSRSIKTLLRESVARWADERAGWENSTALQWGQERMRQEERLGRVLSQLELQRASAEVDRRDVQSQLRILADELRHERRRSLAQLFILVVVVVLGVLSRGSMIDAVLEPILAGSRGIDSNNLPEPSTLTRIRSLSRGGPTRRPPTPTNFRRRGGFRSVSSVDMVSPVPQRGAPKRMARTAHLHVVNLPRVPDQKIPVEHAPLGDWEDQQTEASVSDVEHEII